MLRPEQPFEVPPEYAEVYERAFRRATEEGQGQLSAPLQIPAQREPEQPAGPAMASADTKPARKAGHRGKPKPGSTIYPVLGLVVLVALLMLVAFVLVR